MVSAPAVERPKVELEETPEPPAPLPPTSRPKSTPKPKKPASQRTDALTKHCKVMMSQGEVERNSDLAGVVSAAFGTKVTPSQITRVLWSILAEAEDAIRAGSKRAPKGLIVPSKGDHAGMALYEDAIAEYLSDALKRS